MDTQATARTNPRCFPNRLKEFREKHGLTRLQIAQKLGVSKGAVANAENYGISLGYDNWDKLADLFECDPRVLRGKKSPS
jgi:transcriptional regulator with XRE-family HTH domain